MAYCPECRHEYGDDLLVCPDCNRPLVNRRPGKMTAAIVPDDSWVIVGGVDSEEKSQMATGYLDSSNIPSVLMPWIFSPRPQPNDVYSFGNAMSQERSLIMVPREFLHEAELVLEAFLDDEDEEDELSES